MYEIYEVSWIDYAWAFILLGLFLFWCIREITCHIGISKHREKIDNYPLDDDFSDLENQGHRPKYLYHDMNPFDIGSTGYLLGISKDTLSDD